MECALFQWVRHKRIKINKTNYDVDLKKKKTFNCLSFFRDYLSDTTSWSQCLEPDGVVSWHLSLFSVLLVMGLIQIALCAVQVVNGLLGAVCGDCCGCCGGVSA